MISIYNINKFVMSYGERGRSFPCFKAKMASDWFERAESRFVFFFFFFFFLQVSAGGKSGDWVFFSSHFLSICLHRFFPPPRSLRQPTFPPLTSCRCVAVHVVTGRTRYRIEGGLEGERFGICERCWGNDEAVGGMKCSSLSESAAGGGFFRVEAELSFCSRPRRFAHVEGCSNSSDKLAPVTRSSAFWSLIGSDCTCRTMWDEVDILKKSDRREIQVLTGEGCWEVKGENQKMEEKFKYIQWPLQF